MAPRWTLSRGSAPCCLGGSWGGADVRSISGALDPAPGEAWGGGLLGMAEPQNERNHILGVQSGFWNHVATGDINHKTVGLGGLARGWDGSFPPGSLVGWGRHPGQGAGCRHPLWVTREETLLRAGCPKEPVIGRSFCPRDGGCWPCRHEIGPVATANEHHHLSTTECPLRPWWFFCEPHSEEESKVSVFPLAFFPISLMTHSYLLSIYYVPGTVLSFPIQNQSGHSG